MSSYSDGMSINEMLPSNDQFRNGVRGEVETNNASPLKVFNRARFQSHGRQLKRTAKLNLSNRRFHARARLRSVMALSVSFRSQLL